MIPLGVYIRNLLLADAEVSAIVGNQVHSGAQAPQDAPLPYLLIRQDGREVEHELTKASVWNRIDWEFSCRGRTKNEAEALAQAVTSLLNGSHGLGSEVLFLLEDRIDDFDPDASAHWVDLTITSFGSDEV